MTAPAAFLQISAAPWSGSAQSTAVVWLAVGLVLIVFVVQVLRQLRRAAEAESLSRFVRDCPTGVLASTEELAVFTTALQRAAGKLGPAARRLASAGSDVSGGLWIAHGSDVRFARDAAALMQVGSLPSVAPRVLWVLGGLGSVWALIHGFSDLASTTGWDGNPGLASVLQAVAGALSAFVAGGVAALTAALLERWVDARSGEVVGHLDALVRQKVTPKVAPRAGGSAEVQDDGGLAEDVRRTLARLQALEGAAAQRDRVFADLVGGLPEAVASEVGAAVADAFESKDAGPSEDEGAAASTLGSVSSEDLKLLSAACEDLRGVLPQLKESAEALSAAANALGGFDERSQASSDAMWEAASEYRAAAVEVRSAVSSLVGTASELEAGQAAQKEHNDSLIEGLQQAAGFLRTLDPASDAVRDAASSLTAAAESATEAVRKSSRILGGSAELIEKLANLASRQDKT